MTRWVDEARERGRKDFRDGVPYSDCPYLPFVDCPEGMAWKNAWLAERDETRKRGKSARDTQRETPESLARDDPA